MCTTKGLATPRILRFALEETAGSSTVAIVAAATGTERSDDYQKLQ